MSKREPSIKALPLYHPPLPPSSSVSSSQNVLPLLFVQQHQLYTCYLLSAVDLHLQVLEEVVFNPGRITQKILIVRKIRDRHKVCDWKKTAYDAILGKNSKIKMQ